MADEVPGNDPRELWLNQPTEPSEMRLGILLLRQKARDLHAKTRRELFKNIAGGVGFIALSAFGIAWSDSPAARTAFALTLAWGLAGQYFLNRGTWLAPPPADAAALTSLEFCRRQIEGRRRLFPHVLRWVFGPVVLMVAAFVLAIVHRGASSWEWSRILKMGPFLTLFAVWIAAVIVIRMRQQREIQRELVELNDIEDELSDVESE